MTKRRKYDDQLLIMAIPFCLLALAISYVPIAGWALSLFRYKPGLDILKGQVGEFVGFHWFAFLLRDSNIPGVLINTLSISFFSLFGSVVSVIFALLLTEVRSKWYKRFIQTTTTLPNFISWIIIYSVAFSLFSNEGVINTIIAALGGAGKVRILDNARVTWTFMSLMNIWKGAGWGAIIYLATIAGIDQELYEAARIDGANRLKLALHITWPGISETFLVLMLLSVSNILRTGMDQYLMFWNGAVASKITVLDYYTYQIAMKSQSFNYSYATAVGMLKSIVSVALLFTVNAIAKKVRGNSLV
ncbi:MAG: ABC transporter permease subunit [Firmicutes bacterium]|nr:ABC transporter permease subunit [Bacillota bacterium]